MQPVDILVTKRVPHSWSLSLFETALTQNIFDFTRFDG